MKTFTGRKKLTEGYAIKLLLNQLQEQLPVKSFYMYIQGGSNMTGTDLYVNKPHCAAAVRP